MQDVKAVDAKWITEEITQRFEITGSRFIALCWSVFGSPTVPASLVSYDTVVRGLIWGYVEARGI